MKDPLELKHSQNIVRCAWCGDDPLYQKYHDEEWGVPVHDDHKMFEMLLLETFQAGLSWITILRKRENFRSRFHSFHAEQVAQMTDDDLEEALKDKGIIRNRLKVYAARTNAQAFLKVADEFGSFCKYLWNFTDGNVIHNSPKLMADLPAKTHLSDRVSKDLKNRGFKFTGSTVMYAHMQAAGLVNDHIISCFRNRELQD
jgi:DNA-3-methyladenine glycosylase I